MDIVKSNIVKSTAGRDEGDLFFVLDIQEEFLLLADGKRRRVENPQEEKVQACSLCGGESQRRCREDQEQRKKSQIVSFVKP